MVIRITIVIWRLWNNLPLLWGISIIFVPVCFNFQTKHIFSQTISRHKTQRWIYYIIMYNVINQNKLYLRNHSIIPSGWSEFKCTIKNILVYNMKDPFFRNLSFKCSKRYFGLFIFFTINNFKLSTNKLSNI